MYRYFFLFMLTAISAITFAVDAASPLSGFVYSGNYTLQSIYNFTWFGLYQGGQFGLVLSPARASNSNDEVYTYDAIFRAGNRIATVLDVVNSTRIKEFRVLRKTRIRLRGQPLVVQNQVLNIMKNATTIRLIKPQSLELSGPTGVLKYVRVN
jgi:hypothetical protein